MSKFLDVIGESTYGIALCARCARKFPVGSLVADPNFPALMVCRDDVDDYDPYRLAPRQVENITLPFVRPDTDIRTNPEGFISENGDLFVISEDGERSLKLRG